MGAQMNDYLIAGTIVMISIFIGFRIGYYAGRQETEKDINRLEATIKRINQQI